MNVVIDTNVIASAMFFGGRPRELLELLMNHKIKAYVTQEIINEYQDTSNELISRYPHKPVLLPLNLIIHECQLIEPQSKITACRDPDDNKFLECAIDGKCLYIVSGDKDLLSIKNYRDVQIVTVADFLRHF